ncbi:non-ribosomal peptide synthetase [Hymenobacter crusticola]|uniref:Carrier domain-containing protein n=1 Tax=Hymenobacter crusticola TaxID=1770526 RepID=A0A243WDD5_9BACT|nr:amino acid adenylation domain-containing protein [Hymenobacter crusticola]OUJ73688.1 hypothetical protein BXP70_11910 [Hymenobacter crusticola]
MLVKEFENLDLTAVEFDPFAGPEIVCVAPSTEAQQEIWLACLFGGDDANRAFNESISLRLRGKLDKVAMEKALQALVKRHEALHSAFGANGREICVFKDLAADFAYQDITSKSQEEQEQFIARYTQQNALLPFNLLYGPLFRSSLIKLSNEEHHLTLTAHHIVCDGWSLGIMMQDLGKLYSALVQDVYPELTKAINFSQFASEQLTFAKSDEYRAVEQFWLEQYKNNTPVVTLPTDFPRPALRTFKSNRLDYALKPGLVPAVKKMGLKAGCSFVTTLMAGFDVLLHRLTGQPDIVVGLPTAGQSATGNHWLVGHCVNLLPLRSTLTPEISFVDFLKQRKVSLFDAYEHQQLTFGSLLKKLSISRDASRIPLVPVVFNVDMGLADGVEFRELAYELISNPREYESFELFLNASGSEKAVVLECSYNSALFKPATIKQMMADFEQLLEQVVANPTIKVADIQLGTSANLTEAYTELNSTTQPYPVGKTLHQLISEQAQRAPSSLAIKFGTLALSYQELETRSNQLAAYLMASRVQPGDVVGLLLERSPDLVVALLAIMKCGAAYVPLDPIYPEERIAFMLADSGAKFLFTSEKLGAAFPTNATKLYADTAFQAAQGYPNIARVIEQESSELLYVLYTSGSTGKPKGVKITHRNVVNFLCSMQQEPGIAVTDKLLAVTTVSFDIAGLELFLPLVSGAAIVLADTMTAKDGKQLLQLMQQENVTILQATPATWRMLLDAGWTAKLPLKALCGGEALPTELAARLVTKCDSVWNMYGPTETTIWSSVKHVSDTGETITVGKPIANTQFYILDERLKLVEPGVVGEIIIAGDGVAQGYLNRAELTAEKFVTNPFTVEGGATMYRTGDLGKLLPSGEVQCLGRVDQQVKVRGYRIEPGEIEQVLIAFDDLKEAVVLARDERLVAFVVPAAAVSLATAQQKIAGWKKALARLLPAYMVPSEVVVLSALPMTLNGKVDRKVLLEQPTEATPKPAVEEYVAPRSEAQKLVASIWCDCLGLDQVSLYDNFFELGGHSLIAVQVMARVEQETGKRLPLSTLFEYSTVEKLASVIQANEETITWDSLWDSLVPIQPCGSKTPLYIVHGAGMNVLLFNTLAKKMHPDQPVYGLQAKGLNGIDEPLGTIEEIAAHYVDAITTANPSGPYALAGYSFGGVIAYEMARQLLKAGKVVKSLIMFDTYAYQAYSAKPGKAKRLAKAKYRLQKAAYTFVLLMKRPGRTLFYKADTVKRMFLRPYLTLKHGKERQYEILNGHPYQLGVKNGLAEQVYELTPQPLAIELFRVDTPTYYMHDAEFLGWKTFALEGITIHEVHGEHGCIFDAPNDQKIAETLQRILNKS